MRAYKADGKSFEPAAKVAIELAPGASGQWNGPTKCAVNGECFRQWQGIEQAPSVDAVVVTIGGQALKVRPKIRTVTFK